MVRNLVVALICLIVGAGSYLGYKTYVSDGDDVASHSTPDIQIDEFMLANGMQVILLNNDRIPAISHTLWLPIGSADDPAGKSGLAHYLEHLMFKGTPSIPSGQFSKRIEQMGGNHNAFTGRDFTGYYVNVAKEHLATIMGLEADRFTHLDPDAEDAKQELKVVLEERKTRIDNRPAAQLAEAMQSTLFQHHPYRIPTIGWNHEIEALTLEDALAFYREHYHPANMTLVVAGDVTLEELKPMVELHYGTIPAKEKYVRNWAQEPKALTKKTVELVHKDVTQPRLRYVYRAPNMVSKEAQHALPLMVLSQLLGEGKTSLLYQSLVVNQKIATHVGTSYYGLNVGPSQFSISLTPAENVSLEEAEAALRNELASLLKMPIADGDIARAKTLLKASAIYARDGLQPIAQFIGYVRMVGLDTDYFTRWPELIDGVTPKQIEAAKEFILSQPTYVAGYLLPENDVPAVQEEVSDE